MMDVMNKPKNQWTCRQAEVEAVSERITHFHIYWLYQLLIAAHCQPSQESNNLTGKILFSVHKQLATAAQSEKRAFTRSQTFKLKPFSVLSSIKETYTCNQNP